MTNLELLRARALALRSSVHNEHQLSAIELCAMVAKKTNEIIDIVNELCETIDEIEANMDNVNVKVDLAYDMATESLNIVGGN